MQNLSIAEIIEKLKARECFEASHNGDFYIKIQEYVPYVCTAIHDGHRMRSSLQNLCLLSEEERLYEEDPFTAEFIKSLPITLVGGDSRYEYDLNRDEEHCIYEEAWGKKVWAKALPKKERELSLQKHRNFYQVVQALIEELEKSFGAAIVYDIHSYNFKRHEVSYLFNLGIENIDVKRFNLQISQWKKELLGIKVPKVKTDVSVNHIFYGRGYLLKYVKDHFKETLVLATEVKKVFMDELTGAPYPVVIQSLARGLKGAIVHQAQTFINHKANFNVKKRGRLLNSDLQPELLKLDKQLYKQTKNFEILGFVNPLNLEQEKKKFFKAKANYNPEFRYKPLTIDPHTFKSKIYQLDVDAIEDVHIRKIYVDIINSYSQKVDMLSTLGTEQFLYNSLRYFGEPSDRDVANANFLLYANELSQFMDSDLVDAETVKSIFLEEGSKYGFDFKVEISNVIPSDALVLNSKKTVLLKKTAKFTPDRVKALLNHEVGVHMVTTINANQQPLKFLSIGLPQNTYTQEGLAIMSEFYADSLSVVRLKELGMRVLAVSMMTKGSDFKTTYHALSAYHPNPEKLFYLVARVYRGGGFTKDYLYLKGFRKVLNMVAQGVRIDNLFLGKTHHDYLPILNELVDRGYLKAPSYICPVFTAPENKNQTLNYIANCLK